MMDVVRHVNYWCYSPPSQCLLIILSCYRSLLLLLVPWLFLVSLLSSLLPPARLTSSFGALVGLAERVPLPFGGLPTRRRVALSFLAWCGAALFELSPGLAGLSGPGEPLEGPGLVGLPGSAKVGPRKGTPFLRLLLLFFSDSLGTCDSVGSLLAASKASSFSPSALFRSVYLYGVNGLIASPFAFAASHLSRLLLNALRRNERLSCQPDTNLNSGYTYLSMLSNCCSARSSACLSLNVMVTCNPGPRTRYSCIWAMAQCWLF
mmetsp:Transcript_1019/g.2141  ORF Transcript_1019/g.2141 Transcript_1019/m.2141 type:complete len:263 (-) Transcript_1019:2890-3678(-)